jgi:hypothetical protein
MFPYAFYKVLHFIGIFMVMISLGGMVLHVMNGGSREFRWRRLAALTHGIGLLLALIAGFGLIARLGIQSPWPVWIYIKFTIWLIFGALPALIYRKRNLARAIWMTLIILGALASWMATNKPF